MKNVNGIMQITTGRLLFFNLVITFCLFSSGSFSQPSPGNIKNDKVTDFKEQIFVTTDRDIYITGEEVHLKVYKLNGASGVPCNVSKVVYLELLDKNNFPLKQIKIKADYNSGFSDFTIPENISSGNYVIRAYTNWMKNFTSDDFFYGTISVINPFESPEHFNIQDSKKTSKTEVKDGQQLLNISDENGKMLTGELLSSRGEQIKYSITMAKESIGPRQQARISVTATDLKGNPVESDLSVSVAKAAVIDDNAKGFYLLNGNHDENIRSEQQELAELEGHLINGYLRLKSTNEPLKNTDISLSFVGKTARCKFGKTDNNGEFNFILNDPGLHEIVIQPLSSDITGYYVELSQPFSSSFSKFRATAFYPDSSKIDALNKVIIGMQVNNVYQPFRQKSAAEAKSEYDDFYGKPENTIKMSDYIELTSLREVVKEIIPNVSTMKQNGKYDFKLINKFRGQPFENKPLVLVDGVPVYDLDKILNINSKEIERADVINTRYFYSDNVFDGIVSFVTRKGNLSVIEFDNSIFRQAYEGCQMQPVLYSPDYSSDSLRNNHIADYRNTLYWKPDLHTGKDGKAEASFFTSDETGQYTIVVEGIASDGKTGYSTAVLKVK